MRFDMITALLDSIMSITHQFDRYIMTNAAYGVPDDLYFRNSEVFFIRNSYSKRTCQILGRDKNEYHFWNLHQNLI